MFHHIKSLAFLLLTLATLFLSFQTSIGQSEANNKKTSFPKLKPAGFIQQQLFSTDVENTSARFFTKRARLGFKGALNEKVKFSFIIGALEGSDRKPALVNGIIDFSIHPLFNIRSGQFLVPFGLESQESIFKNPAIERSFATRKLNPHKMFRDVGFNFYGKYSNLSYSFSVLNGGGANSVERLEPRDLVLRLNYGLTKDINIGVSAQSGNFETDSLWTLRRQRLGVHAEYLNKENKLRFRSEFIMLNNKTSVDDNKNYYGGYFLSGYQISKKWESIGRVEHYQAQEEGHTYNALTLGTNYSPGRATRVSLNASAYSPTSELDDIRFDFFLQFQIVL